MTILLDTEAPSVRQAPHHRTTTCYTNYQCRRPDCVDRYNAGERDRRRLKNEGSYSRFTDAAPVRAHVLQLIAAGANPRCIAAAAQVSDRIVYDLLPVRPHGGRPPIKHRMNSETARRLLAVTSGDVIPQYVSGLGTVRRLQAAVADGWPMTYLAPKVGLYRGYVSTLIARVEQAGADVLGTTALTVAQGYDGLRGKRPGRHGASRKAIAVARGTAKDRGWPPTRYWDQHPGAIDDPHFTPLYLVTRAEILAEDARWLAAYGLDRGDIAQRLGVDRSYVDKVLVGHEAAGAR